jgi:hypothetical protein
VQRGKGYLNKFKYRTEIIKLTQAMPLQTCIQKEPGSNPGRCSEYNRRRFSLDFLATSGKFQYRDTPGEREEKEERGRKKETINTKERR